MVWCFWKECIIQCQWKRDSDFVHGSNAINTRCLHHHCIRLDQIQYFTAVWRHNVPRNFELSRQYRQWSLQSSRHEFHARLRFEINRNSPDLICWRHGWLSRIQLVYRICGWKKRFVRLSLMHLERSRIVLPSSGWRVLVISRRRLLRLVLSWWA